MAGLTLDVDPLDQGYFDDIKGNVKDRKDVCGPKGRGRSSRRSLLPVSGEPDTLDWKKGDLQFTCTCRPAGRR